MGVTIRTLIKRDQTQSNNVKQVPGLKTPVDLELLKRAPLTERQKLLLLRIDVNGETITNVARDLRRHKSTISTQHREAVRIFNRWVRREERVKKLSGKDANRKEHLDVRLDNLEERMRRIELSYPQERSGYLGAVTFIADEIGPYRAENCQHVLPDGKCEKLELKWSEPRICGICPYYTDKRTLSKSERESNSRSVSTTPFDERKDI